MEIIHLDNNEDFDKYINNKILVDFYADWCGPCKMLSEVINNIDSNIKCLKVNVDDYRDLAVKYGVMSIPTIIIFDKGNEINKNIGFLSEEELKKFINR